MFLLSSFFMGRGGGSCRLAPVEFSQAPSAFVPRHGISLSDFRPACRQDFRFSAFGLGFAVRHADNFTRKPEPMSVPEYDGAWFKFA